MDEGIYMYQIGELAKQCKVKVDTLRFYEKHGILVASSRSEAGYRLYNDNDVQKLQFILRAKSVGFTLSEISDLLPIELDKSNWTCTDVKSRVDSKLKLVTERISELNYFKLSLQTLSDNCCGSVESAEHCSILEALESTTSNIKCQNEDQDHDENNYTKNCLSKE